MAGNLEFIKSASASIVTSLDITDCFSADYDVYYLSITKIDQSSNGTFVYHRLLDSSNVAISDSSYDQAILILSSTASGSFNEWRTTNQSSGFGIAGYGMRDSEDGMGNGAYIFNPYDSSSYTFFTAQSSFILNAGTTMEGYKTTSVLKSAEQCNGIQLNAGVGDFTNIKATIYGVK